MVGRAALFSAFFIVLILQTTHADSLSNSSSSKDADKLEKRQQPQIIAKPPGKSYQKRCSIKRGNCYVLGPTKRNPCVCRHKICPLGTLCTLLPNEDGFRFF
ncbi:hypothetical protein Y032_0065g3595 [Ancylostoma ceylanicum]|uniref:Uncharacterized protein n=1 Tax=Ancylostoma ceylanicum TaxID=53326 RepID=A0A016U0D5_9BILA|nr:hypothetical protein Y032_0065g3595 [Ancylostoma ceylanicum]